MSSAQKESWVVVPPISSEFAGKPEQIAPL